MDLVVSHSLDISSNMEELAENIKKEHSKHLQYALQERA